MEVRLLLERSSAADRQQRVRTIDAAVWPGSKLAFLGSVLGSVLGGVLGGERSARFLTFVSSAHRNDLDVWAYVNDVLRRIPAQWNGVYSV